jgi:hypothetical protein
MEIVNKMADEDQDSLLAKLEQYQKIGVPASKAQKMAAKDMLEELKGERADFMRAVEEQHPEPDPVASSGQVDTPEFKSWFGDSKVVDADGNPLVVYHSTENDFTVFDTTRRAIGGEGSYFSSYKPSAAEGERVVEVYLSLKNPKVITHRQSDDVLKQQFIAQGHDGVIVLDSYSKIKTAVAFYPEQIKSATGNNGNFDGENPDIRYSERDMVDAWIKYARQGSAFKFGNTDGMRSESIDDVLKTHIEAHHRWRKDGGKGNSDHCQWRPRPWAHGD